jgi:hypothetical protein
MVVHCELGTFCCTRHGLQLCTLMLAAHTPLHSLRAP